MGKVRVTLNLRRLKVIYVKNFFPIMEKGKARVTNEVEDS